MLPVIVLMAAGIVAAWERANYLGATALAVVSVLGVAMYLRMPVARWVWALTAGLAGGVGFVTGRLYRRWRTGLWARQHTDLGTILLMRPDRFELFCGQLLEREGYKARVTGRSGDLGVDIELSGRAGRGIAQVKRWTGLPVGRPVVQQLYGQMTHDRAAYGYLITTSWFSRDATAWARGKRITLIDGRQLEVLATKHFGRVRVVTSDLVPVATETTATASHVGGDLDA